MAPIELFKNIEIMESEVEFSAIRAQGSGGQHVNKVSTAVHLRFAIKSSSLPEDMKEKLLAISDQRLSSDGCIIIKAQQYRSREKNKEDAIARLQVLVRNTLREKKKRKPTRPSKASRTRRLDTKSQRGKTKALRKKVS